MSDNPQNKEAEKVEESLRDFIGRIITYYEKYKLPGELLDKFEAKITEAETLLEVFEVMKEMFEELMANLSHHNSSREMLDCSELGEEDAKENFEKVLQKYESEIKTHVKVEQEMQAMLQEMQGKLEDTEMQKTGFSDHVKKLERDHSALERRIEELELDNEKLSNALEIYRKRQSLNIRSSKEKVVNQLGDLTLQEPAASQKRKRGSIKRFPTNLNIASKPIALYKFLQQDPRMHMTQGHVTSAKNNDSKSINYFLKPNLKNEKTNPKKRMKSRRLLMQNSALSTSQENRYSLLKNILTNETLGGTYGGEKEKILNPRKIKNSSLAQERLELIDTKDNGSNQINFLATRERLGCQSQEFLLQR